MEVSNSTSITEFILMGFPEFHATRMTFFTTVLLMYLLSIAGNCVILTVVFLEPKLHLPMYFFLGNFSLGEICSTTVVVPKMLSNILLDQNTICFTCCLMQFFLIFSVGATHFISLTVMSFDRYAAICLPFRYNTMMTNGLCFRLVWISWVGGFIAILGQAIVLWMYPYCERNIIDHFFCDIGPILKLACADVSVMEMVDFIYGVVIMWGSFILCLSSYTCIIYTIVRIPADSGRSKAFSTCSSHLTIVCIFYATMFFMYLRPPTQGESQINKMVDLITVVFLPTLSPFIWTIRNKEFKAAVNKTVSRMKCFPSSVVMKLIHKWFK